MQCILTNLEKTVQPHQSSYHSSPQGLHFYFLHMLLILVSVTLLFTWNKTHPKLCPYWKKFDVKQCGNGVWKIHADDKMWCHDNYSCFPLRPSFKSKSGKGQRHLKPVQDRYPRATAGPVRAQTPSTGLRHPSLDEGAGKRCSECGTGQVWAIP